MEKIRRKWLPGEGKVSTRVEEQECFEQAVYDAGASVNEVDHICSLCVLVVRPDYFCRAQQHTVNFGVIIDTRVFVGISEQTRPNVLRCNKFYWREIRSKICRKSNDGIRKVIRRGKPIHTDILHSVTRCQSTEGCWSAWQCAGLHSGQ